MLATNTRGRVRSWMITCSIRLRNDWEQGAAAGFSKGCWGSAGSRPAGGCSSMMPRRPAGDIRVPRFQQRATISAPALPMDVAPPASTTPGLDVSIPATRTNRSAKTAPQGAVVSAKVGPGGAGEGPRQLTSRQGLARTAHLLCLGRCRFRRLPVPSAGSGPATRRPSHRPYGRMPFTRATPS